MSKKTTKSVEKMTLGEFFKSEKRTAIHCKTKEQSEILLKAFDEMGITWRGGKSCLKESNWEVYSAETCYDNTNCFGSEKCFKEHEYEIIEFKNIEFPKKKLTAKEITKWILENCVDNNGIVNLKGLDFGNKNVDISFLKTTGNLIQSFQKVGGNLHQCKQKVGGNLYQDFQEVKVDLFQSFQKVDGYLYQSGQKVGCILFQDSQKVSGDLIQSGQEVKGDLYQSSQKVDGNLYSHKLEQNEVWEEHLMNVVRKKVLKPITHKELAEMGFEIKD